MGDPGALVLGGALVWNWQAIPGRSYKSLGGGGGVFYLVHSYGVVLACAGPFLSLTISLSLLADQLFQRIARETEIAKTSSAYGLHSQKRNGTTPSRTPTTNSATQDHSSSNWKKAN